MSTRAPVRLLCLVGITVLSSCAPKAPSYGGPPPGLVTLDPNATATATPFQPGAPSEPDVLNILLTQMATETSTPAPTDTSTPEPPSPTATDTFTPAPTIPPATAAPASSRTLYTLYVSLDYGGRAVAVNETVRYTNETGQSLATIVMAVEPNLWANCFSLDQVQQDGNPLSDYSLSGHRLTLNLARPLDAGASTAISMGYSLSLPWKAANGTFGYRTDQVNLTDWYPFVVPFAGDWVLHDAWSFGEYLVYDAADYDVYVKVNQADVVLAASAPGQVDGDTTHYHLEAARTFVLSASDSYQTDESAVGAVSIKTYYFAGHANANKSVEWMATQSLGLYDVKFAPYPYQSLSIVESDLQDGQEFDGLVFLASKFYTEYNGTAKSDLFTIGTHEIAHQWWFGLVGNDQATEPWLDEAMSVYSERIFYEYNYPNFGDWWWNFRVNYFGPSGYVDSSLYSFGTFRAYVNAVYLNGANMLDDLRRRMGDEDFFAFLQDYASTFAHGRATTGDLLVVMRRHTDRNLSDILQTYMQGQY